MMDKKEKIEATKAEEEKKCCCDKNCDCGCQDGKDCSCCCCACGCRKKVIVKTLAVLIIFLAGMGFHALLQCGFRCPMSKPRPMPMQMAPIPALPFPAYSDGQGGNIIIINTDGNAGADRFLGKQGCDQNCGCNKDAGCKKMKKDHNRRLDDMRKFAPKDGEMPLPMPEPVSLQNGAAVK